MNNTNHNNLRTVEGWHAFMADASRHFDVPVDKLYQVALFFLFQDCYDDVPLKLATESELNGVRLSQHQKTID